MSKVRITNKLIINSVVGVIYQMHPYHNPEGINKIVQKINKWCDETPDCNGSIKIHSKYLNGTRGKILKNGLMIF